jgi:hypothetical protein
MCIVSRSHKARVRWRALPTRQCRRAPNDVMPVMPACSLSSNLSCVRRSLRKQVSAGAAPPLMRSSSARPSLVPTRRPWFQVRDVAAVGSSCASTMCWCLRHARQMMQHAPATLLLWKTSRHLPSMTPLPQTFPPRQPTAACPQDRQANACACCAT